MSGSYAYVAAYRSNSLVVVDISTPASPVIRGSVVSSSLMSQAWDVAVSGSYAYVAAYRSDSLVVVDISNPASPVIRGSVVSSILMDGVREARSCGAWLASGAALPLRPLCSHPRRHRLLMPCRAFTRSHSLAVHTAYSRRRERLVRLRGGSSFRFAGGGRHKQPGVSSHPGQRGVGVSS